MLETDSLRSLHPIAEGLRITLSRYARIVNSFENRSGSIFRQNTKAKCLVDDVKHGVLVKSKNSYLEECFYYIHRNPLKSGLVEDLSDWHHSAYREYIGKATDGICDIERAKRDCGFVSSDFWDRCHASEVQIGS